MYVAMVFDALAGPPPVMIQTRSNSCSEPMIDRKIQIRIVGPSSGSVDVPRGPASGVAPSIAAASRSSGGIALQPGEQQDDRRSRCTSR